MSDVVSRAKLYNLSCRVNGGIFKAAQTPESAHRTSDDTLPLRALYRHYGLRLKLIDGEGARIYA